VTRDDDLGHVGDGVEHVGPHGRVALERERGDPEEAEVAGEAHVDVGDDHHEVAARVPGGGEHLDPRRELRGAVDQVGDRSGPVLGEVVEPGLERGHERLVGVDRHVLVE